MLKLQDFKEVKVEKMHFVTGGDGWTTLNGEENGDYIWGGDRPIMWTDNGYAVSDDGGVTFKYY